MYLGVGQIVPLSTYLTLKAQIDGGFYYSLKVRESVWLCRKDVRLPVQLQRAMAAEAEATREARAKVYATRYLQGGPKTGHCEVFVTPTYDDELQNVPYVSRCFHLEDRFLQRRFTKFVEITQCNGHYAVQGHSRSPLLVPIQSSYTTNSY